MGQWKSRSKPHCSRYEDETFRSVTMGLEKGDGGSLGIQVHEPALHTSNTIFPSAPQPTD